MGCEDKKVSVTVAEIPITTKETKTPPIFCAMSLQIAKKLSHSFVVECRWKRKSYQVKTIVARESISKEKLTSDVIKKYISHKTETIQKQFKELNITLIEDEVDVNRYTKKKKEQKEPKKSTVQETYELWLEKKSIKEIAAIRKFTQETI